jgi:RNA polymerase sigma factor (sigma-70 family)
MMDDQITWNSFLDGSKASFQLIYSNHYQNLYSYGMRKLNDPDRVRDCIQDVFVNLWSSRSKLSTTNNVRYYLLASLRNQIVRAGVESGKWQKTELSQAENFHIQFNPETELIRKENLSERAKMLITALDLLTPRQKEVLYLRYFEELSYEQIADLLNLSLKGVYKLNYRAIDALKAVLNISKTDLLLLLMICKCELFR